MRERLTDEELAAIEDQCDGFSLLMLNPAAQQDVHAMLAEIRERRAADLTAEDREALLHAREFVADDHCKEIGCVSTSCQRNERAMAVIDRLLEGSKP